jgi:hypothetical protein
MKIVITESQYSTLTRRYASWAPLEEIVNMLLDFLDVKKSETFDLFYIKIKEHTTSRILRDMIMSNMLDTPDYVNRELNDLVEKIKNDVHSYIDNNLKDKIEDYYTKHSKKTRKKKSNLDEVELTERCWKGYTQKGMKTMFGKRYPNCVKIKK